MPKQHVVFGRPVPRIAPRRVSLLLAAISIFAVFTLIITLPSGIPTGPSLSKFTDHKFSIPKFTGAPSWSAVFNPFRQPSHPPPRQTNDTHGESSWYADWKWLSIPFSSSITLDENRSLLPPLQKRPPIYCYYDNTLDKPAASKDAESALLLTWRRAWWAHGFKPVILSPAEAMNNPMYEELQRLKMEPAMKTEMMRWLAWENMRGGLLAHYSLLPMGSYEDPLLTYLRRGEYPVLTRWKGLDGGLFLGSKPEITAVVKMAMRNPEIATATDFVAAVPTDEKDPFTVDDVPEALAFYDAKTIAKKYSKVGDLIEKDRPAGLKILNQLINSHLHITWQNVFSDGIAVLKPYPDHTTHMIQHTFELADRLSQCSESPMPSSCPPNLPNCTPCVARPPGKVTTPAYYRNKSTLYTIGTVPHPYTLQTLSSMKDSLTIRWIRRDSKRDAWIAKITQEILGTAVSGAPRLIYWKEQVASETATSRSLWVAAEKEIPEDIDYHFGFAVPKPGMDKGTSETVVPGSERRPQPAHDPQDGPVAKPEELKLEPGLLEKAKKMGKSRDKRELTIRNAVEAWNLADTEAWKFARAFRARAKVERMNWEKEEAKYAGGAGSEKGRRSNWRRWLDKKED